MWGFLHPKPMASTLPIIFRIVSMLRFLYMALEAHRTAGTRRSQSVYLAWWTFFRILHTLLNASICNFFSTHHFSYCCSWFLVSIHSLECAVVDGTTHVCTHRHMWTCKLLCPSRPIFVQCWGLPTHNRIRLLHSCPTYHGLLTCTPSPYRCHA